MPILYQDFVIRGEKLIQFGFSTVYMSSSIVAAKSVLVKDITNYKLFYIQGFKIAYN